jgi:hypothetical protein
MAPERRKQFLLAALGLVLAVVLYWQWGASPGPLAAPSVRSAVARRPTPSGSRTPAENALDVHLKALGDVHPKPTTSRNLFRFKPKPAPPTPPPSVARGQAAHAPTGPPLPSIPPIPLKFIGIVESADRSLRIAVLRDPQGNILNGSEGAIIDGRYQILRIGAESIEMAYVDGSGRQTIRLSGS